jgi:predicted acetyltransferase
VGSSGAFSMQLTVPGGAVVPASGITGVGVVPDARRRGVLRQMMSWLFEDASKHHEPLAILWASEAAIYQRFGFGMGTLVSSFEVERDRIVFRDPLPPRDDVRVRMVDVEEGARLAAPIYEHNRQLVPGTLEREELEWLRMIMADASWMRGKNGPKYRVVLEVGGEPRAYATYRINGDWSPRGSANTVVIVDFQALDPEAEQYLWQWLVSMDLATTVKTMRGPFPHPLQLMLLEPRRLGLMVGDGMWLRIVDVAGALGARTYTGEGSLVLELTDTVLPANAGRWKLTVDHAGVATVKPSRAEPDLVLDISALAGSYLGAWRFLDLAAAGRVRECHPGALHTADVLFTPSRAAYSNTMF